MRRAAIPFLDILFGMVLSLFILVNPKADPTPPPSDYSLTMTWPEGPVDMDIYIQLPNGEIAWFRRKDLGVVLIDHDDLGISGDPSLYNEEEVKWRSPPEGCYFISVHHYAGTGAGDMTLSLHNRLRRIAFARFPMPPLRQERPVWRFCLPSEQVTPSNLTLRNLIS